MNKQNLTEFGLYIHWPFCIKKCPYCDFNSYVFEHEPRIWVDALIEEMKQSAKQFPYYKIKTIFFGGGTPSLIPPKYIKDLINTAKGLWKHRENLEITLETNPSSIETHALESFMENGINRFSIGMQSLDNQKLQFLGRLHSAEEAIEIITYAAKICDNVSGDFIYSLPSDTTESWKSDLDKILTLADRINLKHLSLYQLTIEENTAFEQQVRTKLWSPMDEDLQSILYRHTYETISKNWDFYEISNSARKNIQSPKQENVSRGTYIADNYKSQHNLVYWNYEPYLGIGAGAHSRMLNNGIDQSIKSNAKINKVKFHNIKNPQKWLETVINYSEKSFFDKKLEKEVLNDELEFQEKALMGLRLTDGIAIDEFEYQFINHNNLQILIDGGFIEHKNNHLKTTLHGRLCLNAVLRLLVG